MLLILDTVWFNLLLLCSELYQHLSVYSEIYEKGEEEENNNNIHGVLCKSYHICLMIYYSLFLNIEMVFVTRQNRMGFHHLDSIITKSKDRELEKSIYHPVPLSRTGWGN